MEKKKTSRKKTLHLMQWNSEGIYKKKIFLTEKLDKDKIDVACLQKLISHRKTGSQSEGTSVLEWTEKGATREGS